MDKILAILKLIRFNNLVIITLIQLFIKYFIINVFLDYYSLNNLYWIIYLFALISIIAAGYIINDICDIETDNINKPNRLIINNIISESFARKIYIGLNIFGLSLGFIVSYLVNHPLYSFIFLFFAFSLYKYSTKYKRYCFIGNLQIAFLTSLSVLNIILFDLMTKDCQNSNGYIIIIKVIAIYAIFSFTTTLIREIIKDIEDIKGDSIRGLQTMPIIIGIKKSKSIVIIITALTIILISYIQYFQYSVINSTFNHDLSIWGADRLSFYYTSLIQLLCIFLIYKTYSASEKEEFYTLSQICKIIMVIGIISIPIFTYIHLH